MSESTSSGKIDKQFSISQLCNDWSRCMTRLDKRVGCMTVALSVGDWRSSPRRTLPLNSARAVRRKFDPRHFLQHFVRSKSIA